MERTKSLIHKGKRHLPLPTGPYTVGCNDIMTSFLKFGVFVRLYYPTESQGILERHLQWPLWIPNKEYLNGYAARVGVPPFFYRIFHHILVGKLYIPAVWQAPLRPTDKKYPLVIFSHGLSGWRTSYSALCLELASYGFVVAAVEHRDHSASASFYKKQARMSVSGSNPGSALCDLNNVCDVPMQFEWNDVIDGKWDLGSAVQDIGPFCHANEWMLYQPANKENKANLRSRQVRYRSKECSEVLDLLENLNLGRFVANVVDQNFDSRMFKNQLDLTKSFFIGHSFGGATGILCLATEVRFRAGILLDPWMFPFFEDQTSFSMISKPFLCLLIKSFQTEESMKVIKCLQKMTRDGIFVTMKKAYHRDLCDAPFVPKYPFCLPAKACFRIERFAALDLSADIILQYLGSFTGGCVKASSSKLISLREKYLVDED
ncbi:platelet-activating factor acetylhydrolase-like [Stegodyphus dumicola]|uniref:platelet-activating factor acetylhydrolase-like n=1 Tax=Stegodyphus dumicola TaxID=202533 RepID=UPI0015A8D4BB|nr:platelet-activating factor acetylhydrolase-like [Stegodyphus dumicola]